MVTQKWHAFKIQPTIMSKLIPIFSIVLIFLLSLTSNNISAQIQPTPEQIEKVKTRKLLVVQEEPDEYIIKQLSKVNINLVDTYKIALKLYNANLKIAIDSFWTFHDEYKMVTIQEAKEIEKSKSKEYVIISPSTTGTNYYFNNGWTDYDVKQHKLNYHKFSLAGSYGLAITLIEDFGEKYIGYAPSNRFLPTKTEMACMIHTINMQLSGLKEAVMYRNMEDALLAANVNCKDLRDLTLLINVNNLASELSIQKVKSLYPYDVEILDDSKIDEIIYSKKEGYVYLFPISVYAINNPYLSYSTLNTNSIEGIGVCTLNAFDFKVKNVITGPAPFEDGFAKLIDEKALMALIGLLK